MRILGVLLNELVPLGHHSIKPVDISVGVKLEFQSKENVDLHLCNLRIGDVLGDAGGRPALFQLRGDGEGRVADQLQLLFGHGAPTQVGVDVEAGEGVSPAAVVVLLCGTNHPFVEELNIGQDTARINSLT